MKLPRNSTVQAWLLIFVLSFYAWSLGKDANTVMQWRRKNIAGEKISPLYREPQGVDVYGKLIASSSISATRNVVFLLRNETLHQDLRFWSMVENLLASHKEIDLIGYCDSQQCIESIRGMRPLAFPILAAGEAASIQAVADADADGKAILKDTGFHIPTMVVWRSEESSPQDLVQKVIQ